jgi:hypothetical protein
MDASALIEVLRKAAADAAQNAAVDAYGRVQVSISSTLAAVRTAVRGHRSEHVMM